MDRTIDRDRWQRISTMFDAVLDMPLPDRERYLNVACGDDSGLRGAVEELLAANAASSTFLAVYVLTCSTGNGVNQLDIGGHCPAPCAKGGGKGDELFCTFVTPFPKGCYY